MSHEFFPYPNPAYEVLCEKLKNGRDSVPTLSQKNIHFLDQAIINNVLALLGQKMTDMFKGYSVLSAVEYSRLLMRHQILLSFRYPSLREVATEKTTAEYFEKSNAKKAMIDEYRKTYGENPNIPNINLYRRGTIHLNTIHEFPILQQEFRKIAHALGIDFDGLSDPREQESEFRHEMGHLSPILDSVHQVQPQVGLNIFLAIRNGVVLGWAYNAFASFVGELTLSEYRDMCGADNDDPSESDEHISDYLNSLD